jgi:hypothetical protein
VNDRFHSSQHSELTALGEHLGGQDGRSNYETHLHCILRQSVVDNTGVVRRMTVSFPWTTLRSRLRSAKVIESRKMVKAGSSHSSRSVAGPVTSSVLFAGLQQSEGVFRAAFDGGTFSSPHSDRKWRLSA